MRWCCWVVDDVESGGGGEDEEEEMVEPALPCPWTTGGKSMCRDTGWMVWMRV